MNLFLYQKEIEHAMQDLMQRAKIITEGAGALPTAAILSGKIDKMAGVKCRCVSFRREC